MLWEGPGWFALHYETTADPFNVCLTVRRPVEFAGTFFATGHFMLNGSAPPTGLWSQFATNANPESIVVGVQVASQDAATAIPVPASTTGPSDGVLQEQMCNGSDLQSHLVSPSSGGVLLVATDASIELEIAVDADNVRHETMVGGGQDVEAVHPSGFEALAGISAGVPYLGAELEWRNEIRSETWVLFAPSPGVGEPAVAPPSGGRAWYQEPDGATYDVPAGTMASRLVASSGEWAFFMDSSARPGQSDQPVLVLVDASGPAGPY